MFPYLRTICRLMLISTVIASVHSTNARADEDEPFVPSRKALVENNGRMTGAEKKRMWKEKLEKEKHRQAGGVPTAESEQEILDMNAVYDKFLRRLLRNGKLPTISKKLKKFFNDTNITMDDIKAACERLSKETGNGKRRMKRTYVENSSGIWDRCVIPYVKDESLPAEWGTELDATHAYYEKHTGFRFVKYTGDNSILGLSHNNYLKYINGGGCFSYTGNLRGNGQNISPCLGRGTQVHEIGHALGAMHEQKLPASLDYLQVFYKNIDKQYHSQYMRSSLDQVHNMSRFYDISSTMHYENYYFSKQYGTTLRLNDPELEFLIGSGNDFYLFRDLQAYHRCFDYYSDCDPLPVCENGGYPTIFEGSCSCRCPEGLDPATNCRTIYKPAYPSRWPEGTFTLLKTTLGDCPSGFSEGRMSYTNPSWARSGGTLHSPGYVDGYTWHQDVCTQTTSSNSGTEWPPGQYCFMRYGGTCPNGFSEGLMEAYGDTPPPGNNGTLPDGTHRSKQQYMMCCREDGSYFEPIALPIEKPFILYREEYWGCQEIQGMTVIGEYYHIRSKEKKTPQFIGALPYNYRWDDTKFNIYYCVYESTFSESDCSEVITFTTENSYEITSPNYPSNYPENSECMWHFMSPVGTTMMIDFIDFVVSSGSNYYCDGQVSLKTYFPGMPSFGFCGHNYRKTHYTVENSLTVKFSAGLSSSKGFKIMVRVIQEEDKCYNGNGQDGSYTGTVNYTQSFTPCVPWSQVEDCLFGQYDARSIDFDLNHNYCRNIGTGQKPWCYTNAEQCQRENCDPCMAGTCYDLYVDCSDRLANDSAFCDRNDFGEAHRMCMNTCGRCEFHKLMAPKEIVRCDVPEDVTCISPEPMHDEYMIGDVVTYRCPYSTDYRTRTCTSDGSWTPLNTVCNACPSGWSVFNKRCFKWLGWNSLLYHSDAKEACQSMGGRLPKANTSDVNRFLAEMVYHDIEDGDYFWLGLSGSGSTDVWTWDDGAELSYNSWSTGEPKKGGGECAIGWKRWYTESCSDYKYQVVCEYEYSDITVCNDNLPNCMEILEATPDMCITQPDYAWQQCRHTCSVGDCDFPVQCVDEGVIGIGTIVNGTGILKQGEYLGYECDSGYFHTAGNLQRACLPSGQLTGSKPVCSLPAETPRVELFGHKELFRRNDIDSYFVQLSPTAKDAYIPFDGYITEWIYYSLLPNEVAFQIWRKTGDAYKFTFIGQNYLPSSDDDAIVVARIPREKRILVQAGDLIGVISNSVVGYTRCDSTVMPENSPWLVSSNFNSYLENYEVGSDYDFTDDFFDCRIYSIRVTLQPV